MTASLSRSDIPAGNWIDRWIPAGGRAYLRLMRLDRPIGIWLLLFPCWWGLALAADSWPDLRLFALFAVGAVVMRGVGCTINDIADRDFDGKVARTANRPLPAGDISLRAAVVFLCAQLLVGLVVLLQLPPFAMLVGALSLLLVFPYPLMKRITYWPQAWLGLTFNWGALLGWAAVHQAIAWPAVALYAAGVLWTLGYDTIYAHQDKDDDIAVGVKSTALRLGHKSPLWIAGFYTGSIALLALAGWGRGVSWAFYPLLAATAAHMGWQVWTGVLDDPHDCLRKFKSNTVVGWLVLGAILLGLVLVSSPAHALPTWQEGDLFFVQDKNPQSEAVRLASDSPYTHTGILSLTPRGPVVIEAVGPVKETPLKAFLARSHQGHFAAYRVRGLSQAKALQATAEARRYLGRPYDPYFRPDTEAIYCSELLALAFEKVGIRLGHSDSLGKLVGRNPIVYGLFLSRWKTHPDCQKANETITTCWTRVEQQPILTPASIAEDQQLDLLYSNF